MGKASYTFDRLLVSVGRKPYTEGLLARTRACKLTRSGTDRGR